MLISFTGSQEGMTLFQRKKLAETLVQLKCTELIHGDCLGSDSIANQVGLEVGIKFFHLYPSTLTPKRAFCFPERVYSVWCESDKYEGVNYKIERPAKPLERNKLIVEASNLLIATPKEFKHTLRSGTWSTIRWAWKYKDKKEVIIIPPIKTEEELDENN